MKKRLSRVLGLTLILAAGLATVASAEDYSKFGVRVRGVYVMPVESVDSRLSSLNLKVDDNIIPGIDLEYFFTKNISAELFAAVTKHEIKSGGDVVGSTWLLPPTLTAKYHPMAGSLVSPYIGAGVNFTLPFDSRLTGVSDFSIHNTVGWVAQVGADIKIKDNVYFNLDYKYVNMDAKMVVAGTKYKLDLNPNLFGIGLGYRF
jgi:outer membrane protein